MPVAELIAWVRPGSAAPVARHARPEKVAERPGYRQDLDGLRGVAVGLVVVYHIWLGRVSGGVDVFLMLSAFFLTASFARRIGDGRALDVPGYWSRTFKRLVPRSAVVLLAVLITAAVAYPPSRWPGIWEQTWASLGYVQNWLLAADSVDYYARDGAVVSPLQHYWSLSVQGQVFVLWPLLLLLAAFLVRRWRWRPTPVLLGLFGVVFVASLVFSIIETTAHQDFAYFDTRARLWEFALGSLVAVALPWLRLPAWLAVVLGWVGLAAIALCGVVLDVEGGFPGFYALWPTLAAAAVIIAGARAHRGGVDGVLSHPWLQALGRVAYALYLVHWPILITWRLVTDQHEPTVVQGAVLVSMSLVMASVLTTVVENPVRNLAWARQVRWRGAVTALVAAALVAVPLASWQRTEQARAESAMAGAEVNNPGARVLLPGYVDRADPAAPTLPVATAADSRWVRLPQECSGTAAPRVTALEEYCLEDPVEDVASATATIAVVGDSHTQQFMGALIPLAHERGWNLVSVLIGGCSFGLGDHPCRDHNERVLRYLVDLQPDAVFTVVTAAEADGPGERLVTGVQDAIDELAKSDIDLIAVRDNPRSAVDTFQCAAAAAPSSSDCDRARADVMGDRNPAELLTLSERSISVDLLDAICPADVCPAVVGNVYVYLDDNHLTGDYARSLAPFLHQQLGDWPGW